VIKTTSAQTALLEAMRELTRTDDFVELTSSLKGKGGR